MNVLYKYGATYNTNCLYLCGLSTDEKPIGSINGCLIVDMSVFIEMDTGIYYVYDAQTQKWNETSDGVPIYTYDNNALETYDDQIVATSY